MKFILHFYNYFWGWFSILFFYFKRNIFIKICIHGKEIKKTINGKKIHKTFFHTKLIYLTIWYFKHFGLGNEKKESNHFICEIAFLFFLNLLFTPKQIFNYNSMKILVKLYILCLFSKFIGPNNSNMSSKGGKDPKIKSCVDQRLAQFSMGKRILL